MVFFVNIISINLYLFIYFKKPGRLKSTQLKYKPVLWLLFIHKMLDSSYFAHLSGYIDETEKVWRERAEREIASHQEPAKRVKTLHSS